MTKMLNNIEESYHNAIRTELNSNGYSGVKLLGTYPDIESPDFQLPSISIQYFPSPATESADLGVANRKFVSLVVEIFAKNFFQRNALSELIQQYMETNSLDIKNYLPEAEEVHITYGRFEDISVKPIEGEDKEKFRSQITFTITFLEDI